MEQQKIERINALSRLSKERPLTEQELAEQQILRREYIDAYKSSLTGILDNSYVQRPDGTKEKLHKKDETADN